jgi:hypothetical protein
MHPTYSQSIGAVVVDLPIDHSYYVAQIYANNNTNFLKAWKSKYGNKNNLFAYFTDPSRRSLIQNQGFFAFEADMTPTHYRYLSVDNKDKVVYNERPDFHTKMDSNVVEDSGIKIPYSRQLNRQFAVLFCDLDSSNIKLTDHLEAYYHFLLREGGQMVINVPTKLLLGILPRADHDLYRERYNIMNFLSSIAGYTATNHADCFNQFKLDFNQDQQIKSQFLKILPDVLNKDFMQIWIRKHSSNGQPPT